MTNREKRVEKAQTRVIFTVPFFAPGVARLPVRFDPSVQTACTDGVGIVWGPEFFDSLTDGQLVTVLCHETCHCLFGHLWRAPEGADWDLWNQATDHAVNLMLQEFSEQVMSKGLADPFPFPEPKDSYCASPEFKGMAEERIYAILASRKPRGGSNGQLGNQSSPTGQPGGSTGHPGKPGASSSGGQPGSMPSFGQIAMPSPGTQSQGKALAGDWQSTLIQSCKVAQGQGTLPAGMARALGEAVDPKVAWWDILRSWLREQCSDDWDWLAPAMEYEGSGFILPSLRADRVGPVVFATDTSGSIDNDLLAQFQVEKQNCLDDLRPRKLVDIYCDSKVHAVDEYMAGDTVAKKCPGGGGTSFVPVFEHVAKITEPVKAVVYLTDLYGTFPDADPGVPVVWVVYNNPNGKAPFGHVVYVEK
jgi:predicted metal-dependent peptidase